MIIWDTLWKAAAFTIALFGLVVTLRQWHTQNERLKLDLFERRMTVFRAFRKLVNQVTMDLSPDIAHIQEFLKATDEVKFLFGNNITSLRDDMRQHSLQLRSLARKLRTATSARPDEEEVIRLSEQEAIHIQWFLKVDEKLADHFARYMSFRNVEEAQSPFANFVRRSRNTLLRFRGT